MSILHRDSNSSSYGPGSSEHPLVLPAVILLIGAIFRFYNLNWDDGHQLHPDEREIYMVVTGAAGNVPLGLPTSLSNFFDVRDVQPVVHRLATRTSSRTGRCRSICSAALAAAIAFLGQHVPWVWPVGGHRSVRRTCSCSAADSHALLDLTSVALVFLLGRRIFGYWTAVLAMALVAFTVLNIQLSHFYAVDTVLLPLCLATLLGAMEIVRTGSRRAYVLTGIALGAALATKRPRCCWSSPWGPRLCSPPGTPNPGLAGSWPLPEFWANMLRHYAPIAVRLNRNLQWLLSAFLIAALTFCILEPYGVLDRTQLLHDLGDQTTFLVTNNPPFEVPFTIQYAHTIPYVYQFQNIVFWCMGLPLGLAAFAGVGFFIVRALRLRIQTESLVLLLWIVPYFLFVGQFFAKFNRYMLPITPVMTLLGAALLVWLATRATPLRAVDRLGGDCRGCHRLACLLARVHEHLRAPNTRVGRIRVDLRQHPGEHALSPSRVRGTTAAAADRHAVARQYPDQIQLDLYHNRVDDTGACTPTDVQR